MTLSGSLLSLDSRYYVYQGRALEKEMGSLTGLGHPCECQSPAAFSASTFFYPRARAISSMMQEVSLASCHDKNAIYANSQASHVFEQRSSTPERMHTTSMQDMQSYARALPAFHYESTNYIRRHPLAHRCLGNAISSLCHRNRFPS